MATDPLPCSGRRLALAGPSGKDKDGLTAKMLLFCQAYLGQANGNQSEAARIAGYGAPSVAGSKLMHQPAVKAWMQKYGTPVVRPDIAGPDEVRATLTSILRDENAGTANRLKAALILTKVLPTLAVPVADKLEQASSTADPATWTDEDLAKYEQAHALG